MFGTPRRSSSARQMRAFVLTDRFDGLASKAPNRIFWVEDPGKSSGQARTTGYAQLAIHAAQVCFDRTWGQTEQLGDFSGGPTLGDGSGDVGFLPRQGGSSPRT